jgi:23S rRNA (adenine1618-N6)-methyltransferase
MKRPPTPPPAGKDQLHPRSRHRDRYNFTHLVRSSPALAAFVRENEFGEASIDFTDPAAVKALNQALLRHFYGIAHWDIPADYLCPPIPG